MSRYAHAVRRLHFPRWSEIGERFRLWLDKNASTWAISTIVHVLLLLIAMLVLSNIVQRQPAEPPTIIAALPEEDSTPLTIIDPGQPDPEPLPISPSPLENIDNVEGGNSTLPIDPAPILSQPGGGNLRNPVWGTFNDPFIHTGPGPKLGLGSGPDGGPFNPRDPSNHANTPYVTQKTERAVKAGLSWLARHQNTDGSWNMDHGHGTLCRDNPCTGPAIAKSDPAATALALLPFLAYGQTHEQGEYKTQIGKGLLWLIKHQQASGDLSTGEHQMYAHGLATIALCEAYGMTHDSKLALSAQNALQFIESAQNPQGGWRYTHDTPDSDLSVFGWQVMALKSGQMAGLAVDAAVLDRARGFLRAVSTGRGGFSYTPGGGAKNSMTAVGVLTAQYLGAKRDDPLIRDGVAYLLNHLPDAREADIYYWYYATQAMHNLPGPDWQTWNRAMRKVLVETQSRPAMDNTATGKTAAGKTPCATGSWNPDPDSWGAQGGRLMVTSLSCLTLEVYYRYTPLFKLDQAAEMSMPGEK